MWKTLLIFIQNVLTLSKELEQTRADIKQINETLLKVTLTLQRLEDEIRIVSQRETSEREKLTLQLENEFLKFERRLPASAKKSTRGKDKK